MQSLKAFCIFLSWNASFIKLSNKRSNNFISNLASFFEKSLMLILTVVPFAIASIVDILGLGNSYMNKNVQVLEYLSKASFPIYVIHMLINTIVGFFVIKLTITAELKYVIIVTITFVLCFLFYEIIKRIKFLRFIFAVKPVMKNIDSINKNNCLDI